MCEFDNIEDVWDKLSFVEMTELSGSFDNELHDLIMKYFKKGLTPQFVFYSFFQKMFDGFYMMRELQKEEKEE